MAMKLESTTTERRVKLYFDPPARSVAQLPGSMYPTATRNPGPANANSLRRTPAETGTTKLRWTSERLGRSGVERNPASVCNEPDSRLGMANFFVHSY